MEKELPLPSIREPEEARKRLLCALDLMELGIEMMRQQICRKFPNAGEDDVNKKLQVWIDAPKGQVPDFMKPLQSRKKAC